jgi:hypothetical protein
MLIADIDKLTDSWGMLYDNTVLLGCKVHFSFSSLSTLIFLSLVYCCSLVGFTAARDNFPADRYLSICN